MGLLDDIKTLEERREVGQSVGKELSIAYAEMAVRKCSQRLFWSWFDDLAMQLKEDGRYDELIQAAGGLDPDNIGWQDAQEAVNTWLSNERFLSMPCASLMEV